MFFREVASSLYPWDLMDEGVELILDKLQQNTKCNSTYLVALMHDEKRPLTDFYYPHNPKRLVYWPEDSRVYWEPDPSKYQDCRIRPRRSDHAELNTTDWLEQLITASRKRNMYTGAELSHTWIDKERLANEFPDVVQKDVFGQPINDRIGPPICFNHPDVRAYGIALYTDLVSNYDIDMVQTCIMGFAPSPHARKDNEIERLIGLAQGGCFCEHCRDRAQALGLDWQAIVRKLRWIAEGYGKLNGSAATELALTVASSTSVTAFLTYTPELYEWIKFRTQSLTAFYAEIYEACHAVKADIDVRLNHWTLYPELSGMDLRALCPYLDSVRSSDYSEQSGNSERLGWKRKYLHSIRSAVGLDKYFLSAISPRPRATPELVKAGILTSAQCGANALTIGHYDGAWHDCLKAIGEGLDEAGIVVLDREAKAEHEVASA
jgi:hypothetical protein